MGVFVRTIGLARATALPIVCHQTDGLTGSPHLITSPKSDRQRAIPPPRQQLLFYPAAEQPKTAHPAQKTVLLEVSD
jgi:hypothetical protein